MKGLLSILFWSVLAAAFIGPGTITVASTAGHRFGLDLLWALTFSTVACAVLQEGAARLAIHGGRDLSQALRERFAGSALRLPVLVLVAGAILLGCAAYQAGNILGAVAGIRLVADAPAPQLALPLGAAAFLLLWFGSAGLLARVLGAFVALMGGAFLFTAAGLLDEPREALAAAFVPRLPAGSAVLALGLLGTTVVPYNLFLGSGLARGQERQGWRLPLAVAIGLGGLVSMAVVVTGTALEGEYSYEKLAATLGDRLGPAGPPLFAAGLFAAGLSSAITAPLAAALTARSLFGAPASGGLGERSALYRATWIAVLLTGVAFGVVEQRPEPVIILAQALNGLLLPFAAAFLVLVLNDERLLGRAARNGRIANLAQLLVLYVAVLLGLGNLFKAVVAATGAPAPSQSALLAASALAAFALVAFLAARIRAARGAGAARPAGKK